MRAKKILFTPGKLYRVIYPFNVFASVTNMYNDLEGIVTKMERGMITMVVETLSLGPPPNMSLVRVVSSQGMGYSWINDTDLELIQ